MISAVARCVLGGLLACALLALPAARVHAQSLEHIWTTANAAYFRGDVASAAEQYQRLVDAGVQDPDVYVNLALAHARLGHLGSAVLYFERSLWLRPGDAAVEQELTAARTELGKRQAEREGEATMQARPPMTDALVRSFSADLLAWLVLVLNVLFFATLLLRKFSKNEPLRLGLAVAAPLLALLAITAGAGLAVKTESFREGRAAIVVRDGAELREGPDAAAQVRATAREGDAARSSRGEAGFVHVQLAGGARGWMNAKDLGTVRPD